MSSFTTGITAAPVEVDDTVAPGSTTGTADTAETTLKKALNVRANKKKQKTSIKNIR